MWRNGRVGALPPEIPNVTIRFCIAVLGGRVNSEDCRTRNMHSKKSSRSSSSSASTGLASTLISSRSSSTLAIPLAMVRSRELDVVYQISKKMLGASSLRG